MRVEFPGYGRVYLREIKVWEYPCVSADPAVVPYYVLNSNEPDISPLIQDDSIVNINIDYPDPSPYAEALVVLDF